MVKLTLHNYQKFQNKDYQLMLSNYAVQNGKLGEQITLRPYEAAVKIK